MVNGIMRHIGVVACVLLLPTVAIAESNSSRLNKDRLEVGRALIEVTSENLDSIIPLSLIHISEPTRRRDSSRMPSSA